MSLLTFYKSRETIEAGVDEVARGCLFGPVFAAAVILSPDVPLHKWLNDSKKVTKKRRAEVRKWVEEKALAWSVAHVDNTVIDKINIRKSSLLAMELAVRHLKMEPEFLVVDGNYFHGTESFKDLDCHVDNIEEEKKIVNIPHVTVVGGDAIYASIAAASIIAKEHHDEYIREMVRVDNSLQEKYDLEKNVGYGTPRHIKGLVTHGPCSFHRTSFLKRILAETIYHIDPPRLLYRDEDDTSMSTGDQCVVREANNALPSSNLSAARSQPKVP
jgi:ribonuclease HII